jgi:hypothetical protein
MNEIKNVVIIGRHNGSHIEGINVVGQRNITWPTSFQECKDLFLGICAEVHAQNPENSNVLLQNTPGILASVLMGTLEIPCGVGILISVPGERESGKFVACNDESKAAVMAANPNVKWIDGGFVVDPPVKFQADHIEWARNDPGMSDDEFVASHPLPEGWEIRDVEAVTSATSKWEEYSSVGNGFFVIVPVSAPSITEVKMYSDNQVIKFASEWDDEVPFVFQSEREAIEDFFDTH